MNEQAERRLNELLALPTETEWVEFKEAKNNFDFDDLGRKFADAVCKIDVQSQHAS